MDHGVLLTFSLKTIDAFKCIKRLNLRLESSLSFSKTTVECPNIQVKSKFKTSPYASKDYEQDGNHHYPEQKGEWPV